MQESTSYLIDRSYHEIEPGFATANIPHDEPTFREFCDVLTKRWRLIVVIWISALAVTALTLFLIRPTYTASSTLLIEPQAPQILGITELQTEASGEIADDTFYGTEYKILQSRSLAARVIRDLDLQTNPLFAAKQQPTHSKSAPQGGYFKESAITSEDADAGTLGISYDAIENYLKHLKIQSDPGTRLVTVSFSTPSPVLSARIVNAHVRAYIKRGTELHSEANESAERYLQTKLTELQAQVEKSEAELNAYRRQRGIVADSSDDNNKVVMGRLFDLNKALTDEETQRIALAADAHLFATRNYDALPAVTSDALIQNLEEQQARLETEYASMAAQYKPSYPPLAELAAQLRETNTRISEETHRVASAVALKYTGALEREKELNDAINEEKNKALALNDASLKDAILARAVETNRKLYRNVLERMNQVGMAAGVSASNVSVLDKATPRLVPSSPKKILTLTMVAMLALFVSVSSAFFLERFDDRFKDSADVEHYLRLRSLAVVPDLRKLTKIADGPRRYLLTRLTSSEDEGDEVVITAPRTGALSAATEAYRALRLSLMLSASAAPKVIQLTSGVPNEGKTVTTINTAIAFAEMGSTVVLIDADLRNPQCHKLLKLVNHEGLTDILSAERRFDEVIKPTQVDRLACITAGSRSSNPGMLLGSNSMRGLLSILKANYDFILIDSAPVILVTDALHLMSMVDGVVLVIGPNVSRQLAKVACERLACLHAPLLGIVQNRVDVRRHDSDHYYYPQYSDSSRLA